MNPASLFLLAISLPLLLGGCGVEEPVDEVKPVEEKQQKVKPTEEVPVNPNLKYKITSDSVSITDCDRKALGELIIPAAIEGKSVTSIGKEAFQYCRNLTSITIPDGVTSIGQGAFELCIGLTSITIPDGVTSIGEGTFWGCSNLTSITIGDGVTSIGERAFAGCTSLTSITIPDRVSSIGGLRGELAFNDCTSLTEVTFLGDAPNAGRSLFNKSTPTIYRKPDAKGWGDTFGGRPVKLISEKP